MINNIEVGCIQSLNKLDLPSISFSIDSFAVLLRFTNRTLLSRSRISFFNLRYIGASPTSNFQCQSKEIFLMKLFWL